MEINKELIKNKFKEFNKKFFNGNLPIPKNFAVKQYNLVAGQIIVNKKTKKPTVTIIISNCFDYNETTLNEVILHEMIHYYLFIKGDKGAFSHKKSFKNECERFKNEFGIEIHTTAKHIKLYDKYKIKKSNIEKTLYWIVKPFKMLFD